MRQGTMISGNEGELTQAMSLRVGVDPKEQIFSRAYADSELVFRRTRENRVDDINVAGDHSTPYAANSLASATTVSRSAPSPSIICS